MFGVVSVGLVVASNVVRAQRDSGQGAPEAAAGNESEGDRAADENPAQPPQPETETATFGSGCFWCTEAVFQRVDGVLSVASGYSGGHLPNPTYQQVCTGLTG
ncbi:MAG: peptide-methionine (S)-S-oxide reductase, partial [Planctomycetales bacterium]|nr:peptide-methionine (S)-S-oxide reductase [Planctomycetales bacterium]